MESLRHAKKRTSTNEVHGDINNESNTIKLDLLNNVCIRKERISKSLISIWYTNADVLTRTKIHELELGLKDSPPDIISITDVKPKNYQREVSEIDYMIEGDDFVSSSLEDKGPTRGVGIYVKELQKSTEKCVPKEMVSIELNLSNQEKMIICSIYRSPNSSAKEDEDINVFFKSVVTLNYAHKLIMGDFNRKYIDWANDYSNLISDCAFIESIPDSYMTQHINAPTQGRGANKPATLDLVFTSNKDSIEKLDIDAPLDKLDHSVLKFWYRCRPEEVSDKKIADYGKGDFEKMKRLINIDWKLFFHDYEDDIDQMWEIFYKRLQCAEEEYIPQKVVKSGKRKFKYPLDRASLGKRKKKNRLWKRYMITRDMSIYEEYCRCCNQFRRLTKKAAKNIEREIASKAKLNNKAFWKFVNTKTKIKRNIPSLKHTRKPDTELVSDDYEIGNILGICTPRNLIGAGIWNMGKSYVSLRI